MKVELNSPIYRTIRNNYEIDVTHKLIAEWNYNRYVPVTATNIPDEFTDGFDTALFPIESITETNRPVSGIVKARERESEASFSYKEQPDIARFYVGDEKDVYKYWTSPFQSAHDTPFDFPLNDDSTSMVQPTIEYSRQVQANKIVICFEVSWRSPDDGSIVFSKPDNYEVFVKYATDGPWASIGSNFIVPDNGQVIIYYDGTNWVNALHRKNSVLIAGIKVEVKSHSRRDAFLNLIEVSARLEADLTRFLISATDQFDIGQRSFITPLGKASSNTATVNLFNGAVPTPAYRYSWLDGEFLEDELYGFFFNGDNPNSPLFGIVDANVRFNLYDVFDTRNAGGVIEDTIQSFEMYTNLWSGQLDDTVTVDCRDYSTFLQSIVPPKVFYENYSLGRIVWQLCDLVGFDRYIINKGESDKDLNIDIFWTDGVKTLWEVFAELAEVTQAAIFFDSNGYLQVKTRQRMFDQDKNSCWTLRGETNDTELDDIVTYTPTYQYSANNVNVQYTPAAFGDYSKGYPVESVVWQPTDTVVLRETALRKSLMKGDDALYIDSKEVEIWPFSAMVQIEAELVSYAGKQFIYYMASERHTAVVKSQDEYDHFNNMTLPRNRWKNYYSGKLIITERGVWNSKEMDHEVEANGYNVRSIKHGTRNLTAGGFRQNPTESTITLQTNKTYDALGWLMATRGGETDQGFYYMGTRMKLNGTNLPGQMAGIVFNNSGTGESGYYIEVRPTRLMNPTRRKLGNEVYFYVKTGDGVVHRVGGITGDEGAPILIPENEWFELDVSFSVDKDFNHFINVFINGRRMFEAEVDLGSGIRQLWNGKFGVYARDYTSVDFDYLYGVGRDDGALNDDMSFLDRVQSGYMGNIFQREWVYRMRDISRKKNPDGKEQAKFAELFMDEFGPILHEIREFDVTFDPFPVLQSKLLVTNDDQVLCPQFTGDAFGANFVLVNATRQNAVVNGDDNLTYPGNTVSQKLLVFGNAVIQSDDITVTVKDDQSIKKRGRIDVDFTSPWIQNEDAAQQIADWVVSQWSNGIDEIDVEIFGNPLFELGDIVGVTFPRRNLLALDNTFFVVGISHTHGPGLSTTLTLRQRKFAGDGKPPDKGPDFIIYTPEWIMV